MFAGEFAAMVPKEGDLPGAEKASSCHAVCRGKCKMKGMLFDPEKFKVRKGSLPVLSAPNAETDGFKQSTTASKPMILTSIVDANAAKLDVPSAASKPMILTSIVDANAAKLDANAAKLDVPSAVVVSKDEVLPMQTDTQSAISRVRGVEKSEEKIFEPENQNNRGGAEQDPRTQLHREDVVTDVEGKISALKPTEPVSVGLDKIAKSKTKKNYKSAEDGKADDYETGAEQDDEGDDEEENDENADKNSKKFSLLKSKKTH
ncbi:MAG: hypothetical protein NTW22_06325 [Proteobacteria bacterium]|nr:hypothetical protein [Pseudomonadota bacterium]